MRPYFVCHVYNNVAMDKIKKYVDITYKRNT